MNGSEFESTRANTRRVTYQPLIHVCIAAACGVVLNHFLEPTGSTWLIAFAISLSLFAFTHFQRLPSAASIFLLLMIGSIGGYYHHFRWSTESPVDISRFVSLDNQPAQIRGMVVGQPRWQSPTSPKLPAAVPRGARTRFSLRVKSIKDKDAFVTASGTIEVFVDGQVGGIYEGQMVEALGSLSTIKPPSNPGEFDFQEYYWRSGKTCFLRVSYPDQIRTVDSGQDLCAMTWISRLRYELNQTLWRYLEPDRAALASAMLLGNRQQLDDMQRQQFLITGTVHLLAISGLHVGILAGIILWLPRFNLISRRTSLVLTMLFVFGFAWLVEFRPPVVRAAILISVFCYCKWIGRQGFSLNSLALAGLIVLVFNPSDLFSTGAQLSFVAVAALVVLSGRRKRSRPDDPVLRLIESSRSWSENAWLEMLHRVRIAFLVSAVIWLATLPLVAARFHVVAPVALIVNPLLLIPIALALISGFGVLIFGWLVPPVASVCGKVCDSSIWMIQELVSTSQVVPGGHYWVSGPPMWSIILYYAGFVVLAIYPPTRVRSRWLIFAVGGWFLICWMVPNWAIQISHESERQFTCTFLDVGHGTSVLIRLPNGETMLYDCGSLGSAEQGHRCASGSMWHEHINHIDKVIVSHADSDHFNSLPLLFDQFSVGEVVISQAMSQKKADPLVEGFLDVVHANKIPVRTVCRGDKIAGDQDCEITVLNPPETGIGDSDNSNSIVLAIEFDELRLLLPGDLEEQALESIIANETRPFDVVMAPHHGSPNSEPEAFFGWCQPQIVVASSRLAESKSRLKDAMPQSGTVYHTAVDGAIRIESDGKSIVARTWLDNPW